MEVGFPSDTAVWPQLSISSCCPASRRTWMSAGSNTSPQEALVTTLCMASSCWGTAVPCSTSWQFLLSYLWRQLRKYWYEENMFLGLPVLVPIPEPFTAVLLRQKLRALSLCICSSFYCSEQKENYQQLCTDEFPHWGLGCRTPHQITRGLKLLHLVPILNTACCAMIV